MSTTEHLPAARACPGDVMTTAAQPPAPLGVDAPDLDALEKAFKGRCARAARKGWWICRSDPADGAVHFFVGKWTLVREFATLAALDRYLAELGVPPA